MSVIYLDNNATTMPDPLVVQAMLPFLTESYANPSSVHRFGQQARKAVDEARSAVARLIGARESEVLFTGGGTESVNAAIRGLLASRAPRNRIVTSSVEHSATRELCNQLQREGFQLTVIEVDHDGLLDMDVLAATLDDSVALASFIWANNETGVLFDIKEIAELCRRAHVPLHADGTQAVGKIPVDAAAIGVDALSLAAHKFHGPKGAAALYLRRGVRWRPLIVGGPQETSRRGGTENVPGIVGMGVAADLARQHLPLAAVAQMRDRFENEVLRTIPQTSINGARDRRVPNTTNISFARIEAEAILMLLSERGICASAGAACSSGSLEPSHVLLAMKIDLVRAHGAIRFSLSRFTTDAEIDAALAALPEVIERLRKVLGQPRQTA